MIDHILAGRLRDADHRITMQNAVALLAHQKFLPDGKLTSEEFSSVNGAPEKLIVHVAATKK